MEVQSMPAAPKRRQGKRPQPIERYRERCLTKIANLQSRMEAIGDNQDPEWKRLRGQKIAQEKRLRDRIAMEKERYQIA